MTHVTYDGAAHAGVCYERRIDNRQHIVVINSVLNGARGSQRAPSSSNLMGLVSPQVTALLGIEHPIIQGGMHHVGYASLAAAVSEAGGLGTITALTQRTPEDLRAEIRLCRSLTSKPFAVNLTLLPALAPPSACSLSARCKPLPPCW